MDRPTRWQKAKADTKGVKAWKRELAMATLCGLLAFGALKPWGSSKQAAVDEVITVAAAVLGALIFLPALELFWNWLQAPNRLLVEHVTALHKDLLATQGEVNEILAKIDKPTNETEVKKPSKSSVSLTMRNFAVKGRDLLATHPIGFDTRPQEAETWKNQVLKYVAKQVSADEARCLLDSTSLTGLEGMAERVVVLEEIVERFDAQHNLFKEDADAPPGPSA